MPRSSGKGYRQRPLRRYGFFIAIAGLLALLLLQTSPRLSEGVEPIRTAASDQLFHVTRPSLIDRISGASARERRILELEARVREATTRALVALDELGALLADGDDAGALAVEIVERRDDAESVRRLLALVGDAEHLATVCGSLDRRALEVGAALADALVD